MFPRGVQWFGGKRFVVSRCGQRQSVAPRSRVGFGSAALTVAGCLLAAFHVWLFISHAIEGRLTDPFVAARWGAAGFVVAMLGALKRRGIPLVRSRYAAACWVVVVFLHWSAQAPVAANALSPSPSAPGSAVFVVLRAVGAIAGLAAAFLTLFARRRPVVGNLATDIAIDRPGGRSAAGFALAFFPRPPPLA